MISKLHSPLSIKIWSVILIVPLIYIFTAGIKFNNSILALLPAIEQDPLIEKGVKHFTENVSSRSLYLIGNENFETAVESAENFVSVLRANDIFEEVSLKPEENTAQNWYEAIFPHRYHLLTSENKELLQGSADAFLNDRVKKLYSPLSSLYSSNLDKDPLMLFGDYMKQLPAPGNTGVKDGYLTVEHDNTHYIMISALFSAAVFDRKAQNSIRKTLDEAVEAKGDSIFLQSSFFPYAEHGRKQAEWEISVIGTGSTIGIAILFLFVFKSFSQLLMTGLSITSGVCWGLVTTQIFFGEIHLFTLIFGASLIGVCVDYSFHFFAKRLYKGDKWKGREGLIAIFPGIFLGALTSILAYGAMLTADFPGLQQVACFACIGLLVSFLSVIIYFPAIFDKPRTKPFTAFAWVKSYSKMWNNATSAHFIVITLLILIISGIGFYFSETNDDIRLLQPRPQELVDEEIKFYEIIRSVDNNRFIMVKAPSAEELLINEEQISQKLQEMVNDKSLISYFCLSRLLPSQKTQRQNNALLNEKMNSENLSRFAEELGFEPAVMEKCLKEIKSSKPLSLEEFLKKPAAKPVRDLYMGETDGGHISIILLEGVKNKENLASVENATLIDRVSSISSTFTRYRIKATWITIAAYAVILIILMLKFGFMKAWRILLPPILAALLSCAVISFLGIPLNLFNILSLLIVLGIGIDYSIFFAISDNDHEATGLAILLSSVSTLLAFGLLSLSYTASVKTFGLTLVFGIIFSVLLAPLAKEKKNPDTSN